MKPFRPLLNPTRAVILSLAALALAAPSRALDSEALRRAVPLPTVNVEFSFAFSEPGSLGLSDDEARRELSATPNASTPEALSRRARLLSQLKRYAEATQTSKQAAQAWRKQLAARPNDAVLLVRLGQALDGAGQHDEAEATLRRAVALSPRLGIAWTELGKVLLSSAMHVVLPEGTSVSLAGGLVEQTEGAAEEMHKRPSDDAIERAQGLLDQARAAHDRAVEVAPEDADALGQRIGFRMMEGLGRSLLDALKADALATRSSAMGGAMQGMAAGILAPESRPDYLKLAQLRPGDVDAQGAAAMFELLRFSMRRESPEGPPKFDEMWAAMPQDSRSAVQGSMDRLQVLARPNTPAGAEASEALGMIQFLAGQNEAARTSLRRAVDLDPSRGRAWDMLSSILRDAGRLEEEAALQQEQIRHEDTARNHLILAKTYDKLGQPERVAEQVDAALRREPTDLSASLARAALLLRAGELSLPQAGEQLARVARLLAPPANPAGFQSEDYALLRAFHLALSGQTEAGRAQLQGVLKSDPSNQAAQEALAALDR